MNPEDGVTTPSLPLVFCPIHRFFGANMSFQLSIPDERRWLLVLLQLERMRIAALQRAAT